MNIVNFRIYLINSVAYMVVSCEFAVNHCELKNSQNSHRIHSKFTEQLTAKPAMARVLKNSHRFTVILIAKKSALSRSKL